MGCSQSSNQVVPCNIYDDSIEKHFSSSLSGSKIFGSVESNKSEGSSDIGFIGKSLAEDKLRNYNKTFNININEFQRQSSLDSNFRQVFSPLFKKIDGCKKQSKSFECVAMTTPFVGYLKSKKV